MTAKSDHLQDADIEFRGVSKRFGDVIAVDNVSLSIRRGGFFSFLGRL